MNISSPAVILGLVAGALAVIGLIRPAWPCVAVACLLLAVAVVIRG